MRSVKILFSCFFQIFPDVLYVCQPDMCITNAPEDAELAPSLQVLPLEFVAAWRCSQPRPVHYRGMVLRTISIYHSSIYLQIRRVQGVSDVNMNN